MKMNVFKTKYRVVTDDYLGYEAQYKPWFLPLWLQLNGINTLLLKKRQKCVKHLNAIPRTKKNCSSFRRLNYVNKRLARSFQNIREEIYQGLQPSINSQLTTQERKALGF